MQKKVFALWNKTLGKEHPDTLRSMELLALILRRASRFDQAETLQVHVLECRRRLFGDKHPYTHRIVESLMDTHYN